MAKIDKPPIAVIITNFNGGKLIELCLAALARQTHQNFQTIVIDNASTDGSAESILANFPDVKLVQAATNLGFAAGNNLGFKHAGSAEWIALLNPDAYAAPDWLEKFIFGAKSSVGFDFWGCTMRLADTPEFLDGTADIYHVSGLSWRRDHGASVKLGRNKGEEIFAPCAAAALFRRHLLDEVGGFDERYFCYHEDVDLAFRLRLRGYRCGYVPEAVVDHVSSGITGRKSDFATYHGHRNLVWTYFKNMPTPMLWMYLPLHLLLNLITVLYCGFRGQFSVILHAKWDAIRGLPSVLKQRSKIQSGAKIKWQQIRPLMARGIFSLWYRN